MAIRGTGSLPAKALGFLLAAAQARAALGGGLDEILRRGAVRWGGDRSGGAPYVYEGAGGRLTGFE